ncbi:MAG: Holliday junction resolvase RuvX [Actinomycetota bacterium]
MSTGRALGLDLGSRRIGVAISDADRTVATPIEVIDGRDRQRARREIAELVTEWEADVVVVGLPLSLDGSDGPAARQARLEAERLAEVVGVPVELHDERLTTVTAHQTLKELDMDAAARRRVVDQVAAAIILQSWLESAR